ncbi:HAD family hydrolase [Noviherbaspirillum massiliense]|uniref:HAD family hydrolase n=1 Tax=Noviherbaspirillum massiliense TaxID=1465823 RepID=UPI0002FC9971|nr:HAD family hydrolase [Noviherbaspirillum massiliense]
MAPIKAVFFDLDDTLWPIVPVIQRAETILYEWLTRHAPNVARRFDIDVLRERRKALMATDPVYQLDLRALRRAGLLEAFHSAGEDVTLVDAAMEIFSKARNEVMLFDDVHPILARLRQRVALGSISNGVADLDAIGLAPYFRTSLAAHRFGLAKPDPAIFRAACDALNVAPAEAVYVGDDPVLDVEGAQKAGLHGVWLNRPGVEPLKTLPDHIRPDGVCASLHELDHWLGNRLVKS